MEYILGIDIGTQGTKAMLFDRDANVVADAFEVSNLISPKPGVVWQEADDIYGSCVRVIKELVEKTNISPSDIAAIGIDGQMAGIIGVGSDGEASTYYDSWLDTRCGDYMDVMNEKAGDRIVEITGGPVTYTHGPKVLWWKNEQPEAYKKTCKFILPHGYVAGKMCGLKGDEAYFDYTCIQYSGFGDNANKVWSDELLDLFGVEKSKMARILSPFDIIGKTTAEFGKASCTREGIPVVAGAGDTAASVFGAGMFTPGDTLDCAGTASVLCSIVDKYVPDTKYKTLTMVRTPVDGIWMPLAYINGGGLCIRWFRDNFTGKPSASYTDLEAEAVNVPVGSEGVLFVPHFAGRVLPNDRYVKGSFVGLDWKHERGNLYRSIMESIAYEYKYYLNVLREAYPDRNFSELRIIGGGSKSDLFNQIKADVLGMNATTLKVGDTALCGSAVIAGYGVGVISDYKKTIISTLEKQKEYKGNSVNTENYDRYYNAYLTLLDSLGNLYRNDIYSV